MRVLILALAFLLSACSGGEAKQEAAAAVEVFHARLNADQIDEIIRDADPRFTEAMGEENARKFFGSLRQKFGAFQSSDESGWNVNYNTGGNTVVLAYQSEFANGPVQETFTFANDNGIALLGYNVNSPLLVME